MSATVSPDLTEAVRHDFAGLGTNSVSGDVDHYLSAFADPTYAVTLDARPLAERDSDLDALGLHPEMAWKLASLASWLFVARPVGCPVRSGIPRIVTAMRAVLADPRSAWALESRYYDEDKLPVRVKRHAAMVEHVGGTPVPRPANSKGTDEDWTAGRDNGTLLLAPFSRFDGSSTTVLGGFWTAKLAPDTVQHIQDYMRAVSLWKTDSTTIMTAMRIRSDGFGELGARVANTDVPDGGFEANPLASAPVLVGQVAKARSLSSPAAALYLQTLALPEPTKANVVAWNAWDAKQYDAASAELVKAKLLVEAKVAGAGRKAFVPGGCVKATKVNLPIETWKLPFYATGRLIKHVIGEPCHLLFARAWRRITDGDVTSP
jgi:hypothetical protein